MRNWRLTAEIKGGLWNKAPVSVSNARLTVLAPPSTAEWSLHTQTYSLPAPCCALTNLVARSIQTMREPVTFGSSVPLCPVFSTRKIRFNQATTSWDDGLAGLSKFITPYLRCSSRVLFSGEHPLGIGV